MALFGLGTSDKIRAKKVKEDGCLVVLSIEVPHDKTLAPLEKAYDYVQKHARVPGFRHGKAPKEVVRKQYSDFAKDRMVEEVVRDVLPGILEEHKIHPVAPPLIGQVDKADGKPLKFQITLECSPVFDVRDYKKVSVTRKRRQVNDAILENQLKLMAERNAKLDAVLTDVVEKDHHVLIDYQGFQGGKPLEGGKGSDEWLDLSSPQSVAGLAEGILGAKRGETREVPVKLQGKEPAVFKVTVKEIKKKSLPALDDEFAKDQGLGSILELRGKLREVLEKTEASKADKDLEGLIAEQLQKSNPIAVPPSIVEAELKRLLERFLSSIGVKELGGTETDNLRSRLRPAAESDVRMAYLLRAIGEKEKIEVTAAEMEAEKQKAVESAQGEGDKKKALKMFEQYRDNVEHHLWEMKVWKFLKDNAKVKDVESKDDDKEAA